MTRALGRTVLPWALLAGAFSLLSFGYSLALWGAGAVQGPWTPDANLRLATHMAGHAVFGVVVALPARRLDMLLMSGSMTILLDVDHAGLLFGWPVPARAAHSLGFAVLAPLLAGILSRQCFPALPPRLAASVTLAAILAHVAWDGVSTSYGIPLLLPFDAEILRLSMAGSLGLTLMAVAGVALARRTTPAAALAAGYTNA